MDQSWCNRDLNDDEPSFHNTFICGHDGMGHLPRNLNKKSLNLFNFNMLGEKNNGINDFKWTTTSIAFGGSYVVDGERSFCGHLHIQTLLCTKGAP